nr:hypothetical protein Iba_chr04bCG15510 [Ipomoea batatas]
MIDDRRTDNGVIDPIFIGTALAVSSPSGKRHDQGVIGMEVAVTLGWAAPISTLFKAVYASKGYAEMAKTRRTRRTPANDLNFLIDPS